MSAFKPPPLFGQHPRPFVDPFEPALAGSADRARFAASFPDWCKPVQGVEQPWFLVAGVPYWASQGHGCGSCRAWVDAQKSVMVGSAPTWRLLKFMLAGRHGVLADSIEVRPNLPIWVQR